MPHRHRKLTRDGAVGIHYDVAYVVAVERVFFQYSKAIVRSKLWDAGLHVERDRLPSGGTILAGISGGKIGGREHDRGQPRRIKETLY